jgi:hypothetical protein
MGNRRTRDAANGNTAVNMTHDTDIDIEDLLGRRGRRPFLSIFSHAAPRMRRKRKSNCSEIRFWISIGAHRGSAEGTKFNRRSLGAPCRGGFRCYLHACWRPGFQALPALQGR